MPEATNPKTVGVVGPLQQQPVATATKKRKHVPEDITEEATSYLASIFDEFANQASRYHSLTSAFHEIEAKVVLSEKMVCLTRDHLEMSIRNCEKCAVPSDWKKTLNSVEFVGVRLVDACTTLLKRHKSLTVDALVRHLNGGMFRFRTNTPLREIHAALMRQGATVERKGDTWTWTGDDTDQLSMRFKMAAADKPQDETEKVAKAG